MDNFITEEEELLADDLKNDPQVLEVAEKFCKKIGANITSWDDDGLRLFAKGLILKFMLVEKKKVK